MALTPDDVKISYRILLGREASDKEAEGMAKRFPDLDSMRRIIMVSVEFLRRHSALLEEFNAQRPKALVQVQIPCTGALWLSEALRYETNLMPNAAYSHTQLEDLKRQPASVRRSYKYIYGDLPISTGALLESPHRTLVLIRRPGARIYSWFCAIQRDLDHPLHEELVQRNLSFGGFLEFALNKTLLRREIDNGQLRRLAGAEHENNFDKSHTYIKSALSFVIHPDTLFGYSEHMSSVVRELVELKLLSSREFAVENAADPASQTESLEAALMKLNPLQAQLYKEFTQWDDYFYDLCSNIMPSAL